MRNAISFYFFIHVESEVDTITVCVNIISYPYKVVELMRIIRILMRFIFNKNAMMIVDRICRILSMISGGKKRNGNL